MVVMQTVLLHTVRAEAISGMTAVRRVQATRPASFIAGDSVPSSMCRRVI
jgi:hypothetical protein